jgi:hypothetical protein
MSLKTRGQDVTLRIAVDGELLDGSMLKAKNFTATPRIDLKEDDYLGEQETDLDVQANGWDMSWEIDIIDSVGLDLMDTVVEREQARDAHPDITVTVVYSFREPGARGRMYVFHEVFVKPDEEGSSGRKENSKIKFSAKAKRRKALNL